MNTLHRRYWAIYLCFLTLLIGTNCFGQRTKADSLIKAYNDEAAPDTARVEALIYLAGSRFGIDYPDTIIHLFQQGELLLKATKSPFFFIQQASQRGLAHVRLEQYQEGLVYVQEAVARARTFRDTGQIIRNLSYNANCYLGLGRFAKAIEADIEALLLAEKTEEDGIAIALTHNIGLVYLENEEYEKAQEYISKSLVYFRSVEQRRNEVISLNNLGKCYTKLKDYRRGLKYYLSSVTIAKEIGAGREEANALNNLARIHRKLGNITPAREYARRGFEKAKEIDEPLVYTFAYLTQADLYKTISPDTALYYAQSAFTLARKTGNQVYLEEAAKVLSRLYEVKGDYKQGLAMHKIWRVVNDSLYNKESKRTLYKNEARYEYEKQRITDLENFRGKLLSQRHSMWLKTCLLIVFLVVFSLGVYVYFRRNSKSKVEGGVAEKPKGKDFAKRIARESIVGEEVGERIRLNKERIEARLRITIGESAWRILNVLFDNPTISNREIAEQVHLSVEGVSSSLRRMYRSFGLQSKKRRNLKVALLARAIELSADEQEE